MADQAVSEATSIPRKKDVTAGKALYFKLIPGSGGGFLYGGTHGGRRLFKTPACTDGVLFHE